MVKDAAGGGAVAVLLGVCSVADDEMSKREGSALQLPVA